MFMPQANVMSPDFAGVNSITTDSFSGSARHEACSMDEPYLARLWKGV